MFLLRWRRRRVKESFVGSEVWTVDICTEALLCWWQWVSWSQCECSCTDVRKYLKSMTVGLGGATEIEEPIDRGSSKEREQRNPETDRQLTLDDVLLWVRIIEVRYIVNFRFAVQADNCCSIMLSWHVISCSCLLLYFNNTTLKRTSILPIMSWCGVLIVPNWFQHWWIINHT